MKALYRDEIGELRIIKVEEPMVKNDNDVKIKVNCCSIGPDDLRGFQEGDIHNRKGIIGFEMVGTIVDLGSRAEENGLKVGDRVTGTPFIFCGVCKKCLSGKENWCSNVTVNAGVVSEYLIFHHRQVIPIDESIDDKMACLIEPVAGVLQAISRIEVSLNDVVAIYGARLYGYAMAKLIGMKGAKKIVVIDEEAHFRQVALKSVADYALDPYSSRFKRDMLKLANYEGYDLVINTSNHLRKIDETLNYITRGGTFLLASYSEYGRKVSISSDFIYYSNMSIIGSCIYDRNNMIEARNLINRLSLNELSYIEFPLSKFDEAFQALMSSKYHRVYIRLSNF